MVQTETAPLFLLTTIRNWIIDRSSLYLQQIYSKVSPWG
jgi:hypothetical protein